MAILGFLVGVGFGLYLIWRALVVAGGAVMARAFSGKAQKGLIVLSVILTVGGVLVLWAALCNAPFTLMLVKQ